MKALLKFVFKTLLWTIIGFSALMMIVSNGGQLTLEDAAQKYSETR